MDDDTATIDTEAAVATRDGAPGWLIWAMIVLASVIALGAGLNSWMKREFLDTDNWVDSTDELLANDDVRLALSTFLVDELYANVDVSSDLSERLPENLQFLAGPISGAVQGSAVNVVDRLLATDQAQEIWARTNRAAHEALVKVLRDEGNAVSTTDGKVTLELGDLVRELGTKVGVPAALLDKLPADAGQVVIADSDELADAQTAVKVIDFLSVFLFLLVVALYVGAVVIAVGRRRETLRSVGLALGATGLLLLVIHRIAVEKATELLTSGPSVEDAVRAVITIETNLMTLIAWTGIVVGVLIALYAILIGPSRPAVGVRRAVGPALSNPFAMWFTVIVVLLIAAALIPQTVIASWLVGIVLAIGLIAGVEVLRRQLGRESRNGALTE